MKLSEQTDDLEIPMQGSTGQQSLIHPVVLHDQAGATLIDTGMAGQFDQLEAAFENAGVRLEDIRRIILTHQDIDHIGGVPALRERLGSKVEVYAHAADKPYLEGEIPLIKWNRERLAPMLQSAPPEVKQHLEALLDHPPVGKVDQLLEDGQLLAWHGGIRVIHTPGHTPGHLSLYLEAENLLIAADAMRVVDGQLVGPSEMNTPDMALATKSLAKFLAFPIERVLCYHGGLFEDQPLVHIAKLAEAAPQG